MMVDREEKFDRNDYVVKSEFRPCNARSITKDNRQKICAEWYRLKDTYGLSIEDISHIFGRSKSCIYAGISSYDKLIMDGINNSCRHRPFAIKTIKPSLNPALTIALDIDN